MNIATQQLPAGMLEIKDISPESRRKLVTELITKRLRRKGYGDLMINHAVNMAVFWLSAGYSAHRAMTVSIDTINNVTQPTGPTAA